MVSRVEKAIALFEKKGLFVEGENKNVLYISVPEYSYMSAIDKDYSEGLGLARKFKQMIKAIAGDTIIVKYKIRPGEYWSRLDEISISSDN